MKKRNRSGGLFALISAALLLLLLWFILRGAGAAVKGLTGNQSSALQTLAPVQTPLQTPKPSSGSSAKPVSAEAERYFRRRLSGAYLDIYDMLVQVLAQHPEVIEDIKADNIESLKEAYLYVVYDYPEYF